MREGEKMPSGFGPQASEKNAQSLHFLAFNVFSTLKEGVAGGGERLPEANIASPFRRKECVGDAALRGSDQGKPP